MTHSHSIQLKLNNNNFLPILDYQLTSTFESSLLNYKTNCVKQRFCQEHCISKSNFLKFLPLEIDNKNFPTSLHLFAAKRNWIYIINET